MSEATFSYKKLIAFLLLAIQIFISTPVQFYHHHKYAVGSANKNNHATVTEICPVCNHQYTTYFNDYVFNDIVFNHSQSTQRYVVAKQNLIAVFRSGLSNKSPPLFA